MNISVIVLFSFVVVLLLAVSVVLRREARGLRREMAAEREEAARQVGELDSRLAESQARIVTLTEERGRVQAESDGRQVRIEALEARIAELQRAAVEDRERRQKESEQMQQTMREQFRNMAGDILEEKSRQFKQTNSEAVEMLLKPFRENITEFRKRVEDIHRDDLERHGALRNELHRLMELNRQITDETTNLTNALKGNSKVQGDMGEMILTTILDHSNLVKGEHYYVQPNLKDEAGNNLRPDVILNLPGGKKVIIDSKVSLTAYADSVHAANESERREALQRHIASIRAHIKELSAKEYQRLLDCTPDFVIMFIPIEAAFLEAVRECREDLWLEAYNKKVILSSPTNLFAMLKLVDDLWLREKRNRNTENIVKLGTKLYDQFVKFVGDMEGIGKNLSAAQKSYNDAYRRLSTGNDNLMRNTDRLREYGIKPKKLIDNNLLDEASADKPVDAADDKSGDAPVNLKE